MLNFLNLLLVHHCTVVPGHSNNHAQTRQAVAIRVFPLHAPRRWLTGSLNIGIFVTAFFYTKKKKTSNL
jgi:hypothetical protein